MAAALPVFEAAAQTQDTTRQDTTYRFTDITRLPATSVKDQNRAGTCWSWSTTSFLESEMMRLGKDSTNLSAMYFVKHAYFDKGIKYVRMHGTMNFGVGGASGDVIYVLRNYGAVPKEAYEGLKDFAIRESQETVALLKNENDALPLAKDAKITLFGIRSYAPVYGGSGGSVTDGKSTVEIFDCFTERGFQLNPSMLAAYQAYFADKEWTVPQFGGGVLPEYAEITSYNDPCELSLDELAALNPDYNSQYSEYGDAAIVVVGRPNGENGDGYYPGEEGLAEGVSTVTGNILSLSDEEMALIEEAKANFDKVIVLVNATNQMEIANLQDDPDIDAILWIGLPGAYGFYGVADVLNGTVSPSAHLGDVYAKNTAVAPAMMNYGNIPWANAHVP